MQNQGSRLGTYTFAELEARGVHCPRCHVPFNPHLGNLIAAKFECGSCNAYLSYRNTSGTLSCPCCRYTRPMPSLRSLVCGGCEAKVIYQKGDPTVKCFLCKHITIPPEASYGVRPVNRIVLTPPQVNRVAPPSPQVNRIVLPPQVNRVVPPTVNRRNRAEIESTASSSFIPKRERPQTIVDEYSDSVAESVPQIVRNVANGIGTIKREVEEEVEEEKEDKTETKSKKIRL